MSERHEFETKENDFDFRIQGLSVAVITSHSFCVILTQDDLTIVSLYDQSVKEDRFSITLQTKQKEGL